MKKSKLIFLALLLISSILLVSGCEKYTESGEVNGLIKKNDLSLSMKVIDDSAGFTLEKITGDEGDYYLKIDVANSYSLRGEAAITPGNSYKLSFTMINTDAEPVICYSFWKKPITSLRHYVFRGEDVNPPTSETKGVYAEWTTFEETFETREGEDSFMLTLTSGEGTFYIREIAIERIQ